MASFQKEHLHLGVMSFPLRQEGRRAAVRRLKPVAGLPRPRSEDVTQFS